MDEEKTLLDDARLWLRIMVEDYDSEILQLIEACKIDLKNGGVVIINEDDPVIRQAFKLYLKAFFGNVDSEGSYAKAYEFLKASLELSSDYNQDPEDIE